MRLRGVVILSALVSAAAIHPTPAPAQTMVGYGLATGRSAAAAGGLRKTGQAVAGRLSSTSRALEAAAGPSGIRRSTKPFGPDGLNALEVSPPSTDEPGLARTLYVAWSDDPSGAPDAPASAQEVHSPDDPASSAASAKDATSAQYADPATEALSRLRVGMPITEALELLGEPSLAFIGVSGAGYDAKYVFRVNDTQVVALALEGIVTRLLKP